MADVRSLRLHALICVLTAGRGTVLRAVLEPQTRLVLWNQHAADQDEVQPLRDPAELSAYDGFAMVSRWQQETYSREFGIDPARMTVLRNAIAPAFADKFLNASSILPQKSLPPILAYTSTPFRGLQLLIDAFPHIRAAVPGTRLQIFSSMKVYMVSAQDDEMGYGSLYRRCREIEGVEYIGSLPQPQLARAMERVMVLAYPNIFAETSCIAVMEAMASGCRVVTSDFGALPETTAGFARLIPIIGQDRDAYLRQFIDHTVDVLRDCTKPGGDSEDLLCRQVAYMNSNCTWQVRARQWVQWLENLPTIAARSQA